MINKLKHMSPNYCIKQRAFPGGSDGKASACKAGDLGLIHRSGRSPRKGNGNPIQYSCLENSMDRGAWQATDHGIAKSQTQLSNFTKNTQTINNIKDHFLNKTELLRIKSSKTTITPDLRGLPQNLKFFSYILNKRLFQQVEKKKITPHYPQYQV